jgi:hypothetical protein
VKVTYEVYKRNRDCGIRPETLADFFGALPCRDLEAQYKADVRAWLQTPQVTKVCDEIRSGL